MPAAASEGEEVMLPDAAAVAAFSFCSRPTDGAAPLKPAAAVRWMLAASLPPTPVHLGGSEQQDGGRARNAATRGGVAAKATTNQIKKSSLNSFFLMEWRTSISLGRRQLYLLPHLGMSNVWS